MTRTQEAKAPIKTFFFLWPSLILSVITSYFESQSVSVLLFPQHCPHTCEPLLSIQSRSGLYRDQNIHTGLKMVQWHQTHTNHAAIASSPWLTWDSRRNMCIAWAIIPWGLRNVQSSTASLRHKSDFQRNDSSLLTSYEGRQVTSSDYAGWDEACYILIQQVTAKCFKYISFSQRGKRLIGILKILQNTRARVRSLFC